MINPEYQLIFNQTSTIVDNSPKFPAKEKAQAPAYALN